MMGQLPTRVLQIAYDLTMGGVPADIMYPARILDPKEVTFDVLLTSNTEGYYDSEFKNYGQIFRIPVKRGRTKLTRAIRIFTNPIYVYFKARSFLRTNHDKYDAVHCRNFEYNAPCVAAAHKAGIKVRIAHSHVNAPGRQLPHVDLFNRISQHLIRKHATMCLGVTEGALKYMIGSGKGYVIKNPTVNLEKFNPKKYTYDEHSDIRMIMVGSIQPRKNQMFGAQILNDLIKMGREASLTFIGYPTHPESGYLESVQDYIREHKLEGRVQFLPKNSDVAKALSESDVKLIPSLQEGLPNTALEAQAMGVYCFVSTDVERICDCGLCEFVSLSEGSRSWAIRIADYADKTRLKKTFIDMSSWDNREVSKLHLRIWRGENPFLENERG